MYAIILGLTFVAAAPFFMFVFLIPMIAVCATFKFRTGIFAAACIAFVSFVYMWMSADPVALAFQNAPWIPIVPRLITGAAAWWAGAGARKLLGGRGNRFVSKVLPVNVVATVASLGNTVLVVGGLILLTNVAEVLEMSNAAFFVMIIPHAVIELVLTNIICPPLSMGIRRGLNGTPLESELTPLYTAPNKEN